MFNAPSFRYKEQHRAQVDAQGLPRQRCDKSRRDTSTSLWGGVIFAKFAKAEYSCNYESPQLKSQVQEVIYGKSRL